MKYPRPIEIHVRIDKPADTITIVDNCNGMSPEALKACVLSAGESKKKGVPWLNGKACNCNH